MPTNIVLAILANFQPLATALEKVISELSSHDDIATKIDAVAVNLVSALTSAVDAYHQSVKK